MSEREKDAIQASFVSLGLAVILAAGNLRVSKEDFHDLNEETLSFLKEGFLQTLTNPTRGFCKTESSKMG